MSRTLALPFSLVLLVGGLAFAGDQAVPVSPLAAHSFPYYYTLPPTASAPASVVRGVLVFGISGARCDLFPGGMEIPYAGTLKSQRTGKRGTSISAFTAKGQAPLGSETISFSAHKDGPGAAGEVTLTQASGGTVTIHFQGTRPKGP
jgi:hypothetical protein